MGEERERRYWEGRGDQRKEGGGCLKYRRWESEEEGGMEEKER